MRCVLNLCFVLSLCLHVTFSRECLHTQVVSGTDGDHCADRAHEGGSSVEESADSKQETENVFLNNGRTVESSSDVWNAEEEIGSIGNSEIYEYPSTTQYEGAGYVTHSPPAVAEGEGVYEDPSSEMGEVLEPDHKEGGVTLTDQLGNKNDAEINPSENKTDGIDEIFESQSTPGRELLRSADKTPGVFPSDVRVDDFMKSRIAFSVDKETTSPEKLMMERHSAETDFVTESKKTILPSSPQRLTMEETLGDIFKQNINEGKNLLQLASKGLEEQTPQDYDALDHILASKLQVDESIMSHSTKIPTQEYSPLLEKIEAMKNDYLVKNYGTESTTDTTPAHWKTEKPKVEDTYSTNTYRQVTSESHEPLKVNLTGETTTESIINASGIPNFNQLPKAEKLYALNNDHSQTGNSLTNTNNGSNQYGKEASTLSQSFRDYEDKSEGTKIAIKNVLNVYPSFEKEKSEPVVLFEDCPDCDLRMLPVRPSEQRGAPRPEVEHLPPSKIRFAELPEGRELQINNLGLSDGIFLFSYLSEFLTWIQPNEFPVELLRDALKNQISLTGLVSQSVQVEAGFVVCLVAVVLLALAVPVVVLSHACYRMGGRDQDQENTAGWAGNCRRRTLVFILQLLLILLFAGMVAMFATNEQLSSAVIQSSDVLQTSLGDVSSFIHNAHLQLHFLVTQSLDQVLQAIYADLDNVDSLLGRPIQQELVRETGLDVAIDSLGDLTREAKQTTQQVERFLDEARIVQEMLVSSRDKLSDLRQQVELFRRACGPRDRTLCDAIDATGLDVTLRLDRIKGDERLNRMRRMGGFGLEVAAKEAKEHFLSVPSRVEADTRDSREAVRRQLSRQRVEVDDKSRALEQFAREISSKVNDVKYEAGFWMRDIDQFEYWRWIVCMGGGAAVLMIWSMLLCSLCCGCCGSEKAAGPTILVTIVLVCLFSTVLWTMVLVGLLVGGHGDVFVCRPLYDEPEFHVITDLVDQPGVFYRESRGGFIGNVLYGNDSLDVPVKQVLNDCQDNRAIYPTLGLHRVFDVETAVDQHRWSSVNTHLRAVRANLSTLEILSPPLQDHLSDLLATLSVNFTEHRMMMSKPVTGKDLDSFARQLDNIGNQLRDLATASRMETLSTRTRRLIDSHIRPLEGRKDALVYQLTALEVQTGPLQRQVNQSLSHLKTIQFFINSQGEAIAQRKSREYVDRLVSYVDQLRRHVVESATNSVAPCRPLWDIFNNTRLFLCRHTMDPLNGYWFATMWCLIVLLIATPVCLKLVDYYRAQGSRSSGSPTENLMISEQGAGWSTPGYDIKGNKEYGNCDIKQ